jgi:hypothetical protein
MRQHDMSDEDKVLFNGSIIDIVSHFMAISYRLSDTLSSSPWTKHDSKMKGHTYGGLYIQIPRKQSQMLMAMLFHCLKAQSKMHLHTQIMFKIASEVVHINVRKKSAQIHQVADIALVPSWHSR